MSFFRCHLGNEKTPKIWETTALTHRCICIYTVYVYIYICTYRYTLYMWLYAYPCGLRVSKDLTTGQFKIHKGRMILNGRLLMLCRQYCMRMERHGGWVIRAMPKTLVELMRWHCSLVSCVLSPGMLTVTLPFSFEAWWGMWIPDCSGCAWGNRMPSQSKICYLKCSFAKINPFLSGIPLFIPASFEVYLTFAEIGQ